MFSVFKKLANKNEAPSVSIPESVGQTMSDSLKKRFSRGVQYNMKVVIKGDRNVGKSCLLERLQGKAFIEQYTPTEQIQVASIQWSFKATDDVVKVEVWDVVDRGKSKQKSTNLKLTTTGSGSGSPDADVPVLDAEFLDVYKGTHCVVMMMDITKAWTFDYVCRELPKVPGDIPVLLLGNHCDMGHHRVITAEQVHGFVETASAERRAEIVYGDSSMRNGFGLRLLHKFFGVPFLYLQKSALEASLRKNAQDLDICRLEIEEYQKSDDSDYGRFLDNLISKKKAREGASTQPTDPASLIRPTKSIILGAGHPIIVPDRNSHLAVSSTTTVNTTKLGPQQRQEQPTRSATMTTLSSELNFGKIDNVDEFCPDGGVLDKSFLEDTLDSGPGRQPPTVTNVGDSDDDDEGECHNPLVTRFDDEELGADQTDVPEVVKISPATETANPKPKEERFNPLRVDSSVVLLPKANQVLSSPTVDDGNGAAKDDADAGHTADSGERKFSLSSVELELERVGTTGVKAKLGADYGYGWGPIDTKERRSPEGGEDVVSTSSVNRSKSSGEKKSKDKDKKHKKKKSSKEKDETRDKGEGKHHRSSKRKSHVDEFLKEMQSNADGAGDDPVDEAYEAI
ncbi:rab-like protein 6 [Anopheles ziemanni]|uniref:rab-like protein 6 n=1 Tax=Anopheles coustani TaxID=139045 RepID=UPI002659C151|nr:rab-like protein 6 [Anopheles coustani]XP_058171518.1 rab-like protein 6 [Anopheles ziemanni]